MSLNKNILIAALLLLCAFTNAQVIFNNGAIVHVSNGGILFADGAVKNAGEFNNAGHATIRGYFLNDATATGGGSAGEYVVLGDWENNDVFTADQSNVRLNGTSQLITGSQVTTFYDLALETGTSVKTQTIDANVNHQLALNDCELATGDNKMTVLNPVSNAITRSNGFVSSTNTGRLVRAANSNSNYLFPNGWNENGTVYYRPVEIAPSVTDAQSFAVRMAYGDPTNAGYDVNVKAGNVIDVNTKFFHIIKQTGSTAPSDLSIYYDAADGTFGSIGRWQVVPQWQDLLNTTGGQSGSLLRRTKVAWMASTDEAHALINAKEVEDFFNFPNVFAPNAADPTNQTFHIINNLNMADVQDMKIFNRWGETVFDNKREGRNDWDGYYQGKIQTMGNYVYMATVKINSTGEVKKVSGNISLLW